MTNDIAHAPTPQASLSGIKPLEWKRSGWVEAFSQPAGFGFWYSASPKKPVRGPGEAPFTLFAIWGVPGNSERECLGDAFLNIEDAKATAQADYERRILSALVTTTEGGADA